MVDVKEEKRLIRQEKFIDHAKQLHGDKYNYDKVHYLNNKTPVKIFCKKCNKYFFITPHYHLLNYGCKNCKDILKNKKYPTKLKTQEKFIEEAKQIHGDKFDYSLVKYVNSRTKIKIRCNTCNIVFEQLPSKHLHSISCPRCFGTQHYEKNEIFEKAKKVHNNCYEYIDIENYKNKNSFMIIKCKKCGNVFKQRIYSHLKGSGCIHCNQSKGENKIENWLNRYNFEYIPQKIFASCKNKNSLRFDFYIPDKNLCIEYQGEHHYEPNRYFKHDNLAYRQQNDQIKRDFCKKNKIVLLEIKYSDKIEEKLKEYLL